MLTSRGIALLSQSPALRGLRNWGEGLECSFSSEPSEGQSRKPQGLEVWGGGFCREKLLGKAGEGKEIGERSELFLSGIQRFLAGGVLSKRP